MASQRRLKTKALKPIYKEINERRKGNLSWEREREREREMYSAIIEKKNGKLIKWDCESYLIRSFHPPTNF